MTPIHHTPYFEAPDAYEVTQETVAIRADELDANDAFPSHDGLRHDVAAVVEYDDGRIAVNVRRSDGSTYSTEFPPDHVVNVLMWRV